MVSSICVLIRKAPYGTEDAFAGFKLGLATIANGLETKVVLMEDGVLNALKHQKPEKIGMPSIIDTINDLLSLDVNIYCVKDHLSGRGIKKENLMDEINFIDEGDISDIILSCDAMSAF
jgi:sulfur relay protein TusC/DsrF